jgi:amino acid transporter
MSFGKFYSMLTRTKDIATKVTESALHRCLNVFDLTFLGVGATVGAGLYVVTGQVAKEKAGPGIVLSFLIAAVASMLAGLCYAEFGCRVSKAGSAYVYTYATLGEFWGFVIGWNMILEYIIGNASLARALSDNIDSIFDGAIRDFFVSNIGLYFIFILFFIFTDFRQNITFL